MLRVGHAPITVKCFLRAFTLKVSHASISVECLNEHSAFTLKACHALISVEHFLSMTLLPDMSGGG
jgi:hypothetical protein